MDWTDADLKQNKSFNELSHRFIALRKDFNTVNTDRLRLMLELSALKEQMKKNNLVERVEFLEKAMRCLPPPVLGTRE